MKTIIWDVDDVLNNLMQEWFENHWLISHPECKLTYTDLVENPPCTILQITISEYRRSLDEFRRENGKQFIPVPEVYEWFCLNGSKFRHVALTAVPLDLAHISAEWVYMHFGRWIRSFNIVPSPRESDPDFSYDLSKKEFLQWLGKGNIIVDDDLKNIEGAEKLGLKTIIYPRPWNNSIDTLTQVILFDDKSL